MKDNNHLILNLVKQVKSIGYQLSLGIDESKFVHIHGDETIFDFKTFTELVTAPGFKTPTGLATQFLKANGSIDSTVYAADSNALHRTGNEGFTGFKNATNSSALPAGILLTNASTATVSILSASNNSNIDGVNLSTSGSGTALNVGLFSSLGGHGLTIKASSPSTGKGLVYSKTGVDKTWIDNNGDFTAPKIIKSGGTSTQFLKADGSVDSNSYAVDSNALHKTGDESWTGIKSSINTGAGSNNGISLINNGTSLSSNSLDITNNEGGNGIILTNTSNGNNIYSYNKDVGIGILTQNESSGGIGLYSNNWSTGYGIYSDNVSGYGIYSNNAGTGVGLYVNNTSSGNAILVDGGLSATGFNYIGRNNGTNTFTVNKFGDVTSSRFIKAGGTSSQFLKADGSVDSTTYQPIITNPITGTGTTNYLPKFISSSTLSTSNFYDTGSSGGGYTVPGGTVTFLPGANVAIRLVRNQATIDFVNGNPDVSQPFLIDSRNYFGMTISSIKFLSFNTSSPSLERMRITDSGNVLIGTIVDNGVDKLQVNSDATIKNAKIGRGSVPTNLVFGSQSLLGATGAENLAIGDSVLKVANASATENIAIGNHSMENSTVAQYSTAIGAYSLNTNTTGTENTAVGDAALYLNTTGSKNSAFGINALGNSSTGNFNVAVGQGALQGGGALNPSGRVTGLSNIGIGFQAGRSITSGSNNILIETNLNDGITTGSRNIIINPINKSGIITGNNNVVIGGMTSLSDTSDTMYFGTGNGVERMRISSGGNMLINTTIDNGVDKLQVNGYIAASNFQNSMAIDGTGKKIPTVDAVNNQTNYIARAVVATGFLDTTDPFTISRFNDSTLAISASSYGVAFSQRFKTLPYSPSEGIINIVAQNVPLSAIGLLIDGTYIRFVGITHTGLIVWSPTQFIQSPSVCQLGLVLVKVVGGVTTFIDLNRTAITIPDVAAYSNLDTTATGIKASTGISAIPGTLSHSNLLGKLVGISVAWGTSNTDSKVIPLLNPTTFTRLHPGNALTIIPPATFSVMDPTQYWDGAALVAIPGGSGVSSVQRLLFTVNGNFVWQYGEATYSNLIAAQNNILQAVFTNILPEGTYAEIGRMAITRSCTDLASSNAQYYPTGSSGGGGVSPIAPTAWGFISGNLDDQLDLKARLDLKVNTSLTIATNSPLIGGGDLTTNRVLSITQSGPASNGFLTSVDWNMFNNKQNALVNPITGTGVNGQVSFWNGTNSQIGDNGLFWDNTNKRLGIGTTSPLYNLEIKTPVVPAVDTYSTIKLQSADYGYLIRGGLKQSEGGELKFIRDSVGATLEVMTMKANGNVGIGTTTPLYTLDVNGDIALFYGQSIRAKGFAYDKLIQTGYLGGTDDFVDFYVAGTSASNATAKMRILSNGNVGIGTSTPSAKLFVQGDAIFDTLTKGRITLETSNNTYNAIHSTTTGFGVYLPLGIAPTGGNVGIGTTNPQVKFSIVAPNSELPTLGSGSVGTSSLLSGNGLYGLYQGVSNSGYVWNQVQRNDSNTSSYSYVLQPSGGNVLIGTTTDNGQKFQVNGTGSFNGVVSGLPATADNHFVTRAQLNTAGSGVYLPLTGGIMSGNIGRTSYSSGFLVGGQLNIGATDQKTNPIYTIGSNYVPTDTTLANMYGIGFSHSNFFGTDKIPNWGMYVSDSGIIKSVIGDGIWTKGTIKVDGVRRITLDPGTGSILTKVPAGGGWAMGSFITNSSEVAIAGFGSFGTADSLVYQYIGADYSNPLVTVLPNGNVGIGTSAPNAKLQVSGGDIVIDNGGTGILRGNNSDYGNGGAIKISSSNTLTQQYIQLGWGASGTGVFSPHMTVMSNSGNVLIGSTTDNGSKHQVYGSSYVSQEIAAYGPIRGRCAATLDNSLYAAGNFESYVSPQEYDSGKRPSYGFHAANHFGMALYGAEQGELRLRSNSDSYLMYHSGNFNPGNYAPLNGVGAYGTWGINITGNSTYSNTSDRVGYLDTRSVNFAPFTYTGVTHHLKQNNADGLSDGGDYHGILNLTHWNDSSGGKNHQLGFTDNGNIWHRTNADDSSWYGFKKIWDSDNFTPGNYVAKSGDTMSGPLTIGGSSNIPLVLNSTTSESYINMKNSSSGTNYGVLLRSTGNDFAIYHGDSIFNSVYIKSNGNVGVGTSNPQHKFVVSDGGAGLEVAVSVPNITYLQSYNRATTSYAQMRYAASSHVFEIGDLLVGSTTTAYSSTGRGLIFVNGASSALLGFGIGGVNKGFLFHTSSELYLANEVGDLVFSPNAIEALRVKSGGNIGIGTANPNAKLEVAGTLGGSINAGKSSIRLVNTDTGDYSNIGAGIVGISNSGIEFSVNGASKIAMFGNGNVCIGTTTDNNNKLRVNGDAWVDGVLTVPVQAVIGTTINQGYALTVDRGIYTDSIISSEFVKVGGTSSSSLQADGSLLTLISSTYTPSFSALSNLSSVTNTRSIYTRIGNNVSVTISGNWTSTATGVLYFEATLPYSAGGNVYQVGSGSSPIGTSDSLVPLSVIKNSGTIVSIRGTRSSASTVAAFSVSFTYSITY